MQKLVLAAPQLLARLAIDQVRGIRGGSTHTSNTAPAQEHHCFCTIYQEQNQFLQTITQTHPAKHHGGQVKLRAKPGEEEPADHLRRRRTS
jgi:phage terminase large subunit GpA-like protein